MSAPDTNIDKQVKRHKSPLIGMGFAVVFAGALFFGLLAWLSYNAGEPEGAEQQIDGRTGAVVES